MAMERRWLVAALACLAVALAAVTLLYLKCKNELADLRSRYASLEANYSALSSRYAKLKEEYGALKSSYEELLARLKGLEAGYEDLKARYGALLGNYSRLKAEYEACLKGLKARRGVVVEVLEDREYYERVLRDLRRANETICIAMYSMVYDPGDPVDWANDLIRELTSAAARGVKVRVVIEYRTFFGELERNLEAYNYLKGAGVEVKLDMGSDTDHMKLVVVDGRIVYVGSHNWSESALYYNHEVTVRIVDEGLARELEEYFEELWSEG